MELSCSLGSRRLLMGGFALSRRLRRRDPASGRVSRRTSTVYICVPCRKGEGVEDHPRTE